MIRRVITSSLGMYLGFILGYSQSAYITFDSDHQLRINSNGSLGIDISDLSPASNGRFDRNNSFLSQAGLWITAEDGNGDTYSAVQYISAKDSFDFWPGPIDTLTGQTGSISDWDSVWYVSKLEVEEHRKNYNTAGYKTPSHIANWPANGRSGFNNYLAPFVDVNLNKLYDPENGDYPAIKGKLSAYCIFNDIAEEHTASLGSELGLEIQMMAYSLASSSAIYLEYFIVNRTLINYTNVKVGFFIDAECGNRQDNYAGTLEKYPQTIFVYNSDSIDEGYFEDSPPYVMATFLNENLSKSIAFNDKQGIDGRPTENIHFINYSNSKWKDASPLTFGGNGINTGQETPFIFTQSNGKHHPDFWSEDLSHNSAGKRTILGVTKSNLLPTKGYLKLDIALDIGTLKIGDEIIEKITSKANKNISDYRSISSTLSMSDHSFFEIYPNPSNGSFFIDNLSANSNLYIFDNQGTIVFSKKNITNNHFQCNIMQASGIYWIQVITKSGIQTKKAYIAR